MPNSAHPPPRRYRLFVLGLWLEPGWQAERAGSWRISLEDPHTTERSGFAHVDDLATYLSTWMARAEQANKAVDDP